VRPRDLIDLRVLVGEEELVLEVEDPSGSSHRLEIEKDADDGLGLGFTEALFDGLRQCNKPLRLLLHRPATAGQTPQFVRQGRRLPAQLSLRSYLTLTNLNAADWQRIEEQRLSPLFVSVHATEACAAQPPAGQSPGPACCSTSWAGLPNGACRSMLRWWSARA